MNPADTLLSYCFKNHFNIILPLTPRLSLGFHYLNRTALGHSVLSLFCEYLCGMDTGLRGPVLSDPVYDAVGLCFKVLYEAKTTEDIEISTVRTVTRTRNLQNISDACQ